MPNKQHCRFFSVSVPFITASTCKDKMICHDMDIVFLFCVCNQVLAVHLNIQWNTDYSTTRDIWHFRPTPSNSPLSFTCTLSRSLRHITTLIRQLRSSEICLRFLAIFSQIIPISIIRKIVRNPDPRHIQITFYFLIRDFDPCSTVGNRNKST